MSYEGVIDPDTAAAIAGTAADAASGAMVRAALSAKAADAAAADAAATLAKMAVLLKGMGLPVVFTGTVLQVRLPDGTYTVGVDLKGDKGDRGERGPTPGVGTVSVGDFAVVLDDSDPDDPRYDFVFPAPVPGRDGLPGPPGKDGAPGPVGPAGTVTPTFAGTASRAVGQHRVLKADANGLSHASADDPSSLGCVVGLSTAAAGAGSAVTGVISGVVTDPAWVWSPGPVYLGQDGALVQPEPASGIVQRIGVSDVPTRLIVGVGEPIASGGGVASADPGLSGTAAAPIAYHQVLRIGAGGLSPASSSDPSGFANVVGLALQSGGVGQTVQYAKGGALTDPSWAFSPGPVFLGPGGVLVQPEPTIGFVQRMGVSDVPTRLLVQIDADPFLLTA